MATRKLFVGADESQAEEKPSSVRMFTVPEIAGILHVHPNTVRQWCDQGVLKAYRFGPRGDRRLSWEDVHSFVSRCGNGTNWAKPRERRVLILDDNHQTRSLIRNVVEEQGYESISVESVEKALEELEKQDFGAIFLDVVSLEPDGVDLLRAIKAKQKNALVAVATELDEACLALKTMSLGPLVLIPKPFTVSDIASVVDVAMGATRHQPVRT